MMQTPPHPLTLISGWDPSGGAGMARDLETATNLGIAPSAIITDLTQQTHVNFISHQARPVTSVLAELEQLAPHRFVKIGLVGEVKLAQALGQWLAAHAEIQAVIDPVLAASSGGNFYKDRQEMVTLGEFLLKHAILITPNHPEALVLLGDADFTGSMPELADRLYRKLSVNILLKGGHWGENCQDVLVTKNGVKIFSAPRLHLTGRQKRGLGCRLSTAIACYLAQGRKLIEAVTLAHEYLQAQLN